jgi:DNA polymerase
VSISDLKMTEQEAKIYHELLENMQNTMRSSGIPEDDIQRASQYFTISTWLTLLKSRISVCRACSYVQYTHTYVYGMGNPDAELMFIGSCPDDESDEYGAPFAGLVGNVYNRMLAALNLNRDIIYTTNVLKCFPGPNKKPTKSAISNCVNYLFAEIQIVRPYKIILLGRLLYDYLHPSDAKLTIDQVVGREIIILDKYPAIVSYHPRYIHRLEQTDTQKAEQVKRVQLQIIRNFLAKKL